MRGVGVIVFVALCAAGPAAAEDVVVMSAGAVEPGLKAAVGAFEQATGHRVDIRFGTGPQLSARLEAGEPGDLLIAPSAVMDSALRAGKVDAGILAPIGRVGVGIVMRQGAVVPAVGTRDALRDALLAAPAIVFNTASTGQYIERLLAQLVIAEHVRVKVVRVETGEAVIARIASGSGDEIGFGAVTEIRMLESTGVRFVAALPVEVQNFTTYEAGLLRSAKAPRAAEALLNFLLVGAGRDLLSEGGVQP